MSSGEEFYVGAQRFVSTEIHSFETWLDFEEWVVGRGNHYDIDSIRMWNGPGSMISVLVVFVRYERDEDEEGGGASQAQCIEAIWDITPI